MDIFQSHQVVFIHTAMKVFVRACMDCSEGEIATILGTIRKNIAVFMQVLLSSYFVLL
jgi:hypothetical protein